MVNVLIVDDSPVAQQFLEYILIQDPDITVIGIAKNGEEAVRAVRDKKPDLVTMDINMPVMNGFEATRIIMETTPVPIIIVTGSDNINEVTSSFEAMEAGAVTLVARPPGIHNPEYESSAKTLRDLVKAYAEIKLVRRYPKKNTRHDVPTNSKEELKVESSKKPVKIIAIGASTGGPVVIQTILSGFQKNFPLPVVIVQHIAYGFSQGLAEWLRETTGFPIHIANQEETLRPGHAYFAPDGFQMGVNYRNQITLFHEPRKNGLCPSVSYLFRSVRQVYGSQAIAILLSGMGHDGVAELKLLKDTGAVTIAQDEKSSVIFGMPGEAIRLGATTYVLSPEKIVNEINKIVYTGGDDHVTIP